MELSENAARLTIYVGESDHFHGQPAYKAVVLYLREQGIWGATVHRGILGYGKRSLVHTTSALVLSGDLPIVIEAVDTEAKLLALMPKLGEIVRDGLITIDPVRVLRHMEGDPAPPT